MPHELLELILSAIAIDSDGLNPKKSTPTDADVSQRILNRSNWHNESLPPSWIVSTNNWEKPNAISPTSPSATSSDAIGKET